MAKKGISVITDAGAVAHKLVNDGSGRLGTGASDTIVMSGSVRLENLSVPTKNGVMVSGSTPGAGASDDIELAINGISGSVGANIAAASTRRSNISSSIEQLQTVSGLTDDLTPTLTSSTANSEILGEPMQFTFDYSAQRFITNAATLKAADEALDVELVRQKAWVDHLNDVDTAGPLTASSGLFLADGTQVNTAGSIKYQIAQVVGDLDAGTLDTLAELSTSLGGDRNFVVNMVTAINNTIDALDGIVDNPAGGITLTLSATLDALEDERERRTGQRTTVVGTSVNPHLTASGSQGLIKERLDEIQTAVGLDANGNLVSGADAPAVRDISLANDIKLMEERHTYLINTNFDANAVTITGATAIVGHMNVSGANSSFKFPVLTAAQVEAHSYHNGSQASNNGKIFMLSGSVGTTINTEFPNTNTLYFCENGVWHPSNLLKE